MKREIIHSQEDIFGMANLVPKQTGLKVNIWSQHRGMNAEEVSHKFSPRVKLSIHDNSISVSIEPHPQVVAPKGCNLDRDFKKEDARAFKDGMNYVGKNYDLFLKHYQDTEDDEYTDYDLMKDLSDRGYFKFV